MASDHAGIDRATRAGAPQADASREPRIRA